MGTAGDGVANDFVVWIRIGIGIGMIPRLG
jgi:hypothetical protein